MNATVRDVMSTGVIALKWDADFKQIACVLRKHRISACPVITDAGRVVGVVSEADLLYKEADPNPPSGLIRLWWKLGEESKVIAVTAARLMTSPAVTISPNASVVDAARVMQNRKVKRLPVVDADGQLIGIISRSDVLSVYERPDDDIRHEVLRIIAGEFGLPPDRFEVAVTSGIVTLTGFVRRADIALQVVARVRHTEGVVGTRDRIEVIDAEACATTPNRPPPRKRGLCALSP
jgi:CBS domain-containing protein